MQILYLATTSSWKYQQAKQYLTQFDIDVRQAKIELPESRSEDVVEIAREKATFAYDKLKQPVIVIDGAFHIKALGGFPKTLVKFSEKYIGARGVLKLIEGEQDRSYEWPNALYYKDAGTEEYFVGRISGTIVSQLPTSAKGNGFDLIQLPDGYIKTFPEMDAEDLHHFETQVWQPTIFREFVEWMGKATSPRKV